MIDRYENRPEFELYDLQSDPYEMNNLAGQSSQQERIAMLKSKLDAWMKSQGDKGIETEMAAKARQGGKRKKK